MPTNLSVFVGAAAVVLAAIAVWLWIRHKPTPEEREQRRRTDVNRRGRMLDATLIDAHEPFVQFKYTTRGMTYVASQDISALRDRLPSDLAALLGPVTVKYLTNNPANSIVICETWSGVRINSLRN
jgi:hypothetical protein